MQDVSNKIIGKLQPSGAAHPDPEAEAAGILRDEQLENVVAGRGTETTGYFKAGTID
jgi:hypothetical protein